MKQLKLISNEKNEFVFDFGKIVQTDNPCYDKPESLCKNDFA